MLEERLAQTLRNSEHTDRQALLQILVCWGKAGSPAREKQVQGMVVIIK
jgi:hypothetical protein